MSNFCVKWCLLAQIGILFCGVSLAGPSDEKSYGFSPALNPVQFLEPPRHPPFDLIRNGKPRFVIVADRAAEASVPEEWRSVTIASEMLQDEIKILTGEAPAIVDPESWTARRGGMNAVFIGKSRFTESMGIDSAQIPVEGFVVMSAEGGVAIVGHDGSFHAGEYKPFDRNIGRFRINGTVWGVMDFMERFLGVRYYYPGIGVYRPVLANLEMKPVHYQDHPFQPDRDKWNFFHEFGRNSEEWPWDKKRFPPDWNKFSNRYRCAVTSRREFAHTPVASAWAKAFGEKNPDLFYRDSTGRLFMDTNDCMACQFDVSRREFAEHYIAQCKEYYRTGDYGAWQWYPPNDECISFGMPDSYVVVENAKTANLLNPEMGRYGVMSDVMAQFYCWLGELAKEAFPGKKVCVYAYANYRFPPKRAWSFPDNIEVQFCHFNRIDYYYNQDIYKFDLENAKAWSKVLEGRKISAYVYGGGYPFLCSIRHLQQYFKDTQDFVYSPLLDCSETWANYHMFYYCFYRLAWNPAFNVDAAMDEYYQLMYGPAAPYVRNNYLEIMAESEQVPIELNPKDPMINMDENKWARAIFTPAVMQNIQTNFDLALAKVPSESIEAMRIEFLRKSWEQPFAVARYLAQNGAVATTAFQVADNIINVDGNLKESCWQENKCFKFQGIRGEKPRFETKGWIAWSKRRLYFAFQCQEPKPQKLVANVNRRDGNVFNDDSLEVFISPGKEKNRYYQIVVNSKGVVFDGRRLFAPTNGDFDAKWDCQGLQAASQINADNWTLEMAIPFDSLDCKTPELMSRWLVNCVRNKMSEPGETTSFSPTLGNNHNLDTFGSVKFYGPDM